MEQKINTNFFESVSKHNLERFHSECLCWLFNNNRNLTALWINEITELNNEVEIDSIEVYTEVDQLDIVILYKIKSCETYFGIVIENKVKANEHLIKVKNGNLISKPIEGEELSQTEYYFLRTIATKEIRNKNDIAIINIINGFEAKTSPKKKNNKSNEINVYKDNCKYIFLVPNKIINIKEDLRKLVNDEYNFDNINNWNEKKTNESNPWKTYTYIELANFLHKNKSLINSLISNNKIYSNDYIDFLYLQFKNPVDLNNYYNNKYGKLEYMKFLRHAIYLQLSNECRALNRNGKVDSASSNSGDPLFNIVISDKIKLSGQETLFQLGLQVQGLTNKIYISAGENYHSFKFKPKGNDVQKQELKNYRTSVENVLKGIIQKLPIKLKPNKNTTKSFYSYSFTFENEIDTNILDKVKFLSNLIKTIYDIYNNNGIKSNISS